MENEQEDIAVKASDLAKELKETHEKMDACEAEKKKDLEMRRHAAAEVLQKHFSLRPDGAIVFTIVEGKIQGDVTPFGSTGALLFAAKLISKYVNESFENSLISQVAATEPPQAGQDAPRE